MFPSLEQIVLLREATLTRLQTSEVRLYLEVHYGQVNN
jgi:hypothetical protein